MRLRTKMYRDHPLYDVWKGMKARCNGKNHKSYHIYGGKGVKVCDEWEKDFISFYNWSLANGYKEGLQIDKDINGDGLLYSPATCCWVTRAKNNQHRSVGKLNKDKVNEIRTSSLRRIDLSKKYGVNTSTIDRIKQFKTWKS